MSRTMYDSTTAADIPADAEIVAGYVDGWYRWSDADWARFDAAVKVRIAVRASTDDGDVLDVEKGDARPEEAPGWVQRRRAAGVDPTVYCSLAEWGTVRGEFAKQGVAEPHWWIAAYPGNGAQLYPGSVAHQWADHGPNGEHFDLSVVADDWHPSTPSAPQAPAAPPQPPTITVGTPSEEDMDTPNDIKVHELDDQGNGFVDVPVPAPARVKSIEANGQDPATNGYGHAPVFDHERLGDVIRVNIHGGIPKGALDLTVWTTAT